MTPLYSKETADQVCGEIQILIESGSAYPDAMAAKRLIKNGNEVMGVLTSAEQVLKNEGYAGMSIVVSDLIKKIKGEG